MKSILIVICAVLIAVFPAGAEDWEPMRDVEVYARAKWIVIGTLEVKGEGAAQVWEVRVEEMIKGEPVQSLEIAPNKFAFGYLAKEKQRQLFCVGEHEGGHFLYARRPGEGPKEGKRLMKAARDLLADSRAAILDLALPPSREVVEVIAIRFAPAADAKAQPVTRKEAVAYLQGALHSDDSELRLETLKALHRIQDRSLEPVVRPMLNAKTESWAVRPMVHYLKQTESSKAYAHFAALLRTHAPGYPVHHSISDYCAEALGEAGEHLPALEFAASCGVQRAIEALIRHGTVDSFDMLYETYMKAEEPGAQPNALHWLARRSNRPVEPWMYPSSYSTKDGIEMKAKWKKWWADHRAGFQIVRDFEEASSLWKAERERAR